MSMLSGGNNFYNGVQIGGMRNGMLTPGAGGIGGMGGSSGVGGLSSLLGNTIPQAAQTRPAYPDGGGYMPGQGGFMNQGSPGNLPSGSQFMNPQGRQMTVMGAPGGVQQPPMGGMPPGMGINGGSISGQMGGGNTIGRLGQQFQPWSGSGGQPWMGANPQGSPGAFRGGPATGAPQQQGQQNFGMLAQNSAQGQNPTMPGQNMSRMGMNPTPQGFGALAANSQGQRGITSTGMPQIGQPGDVQTPSFSQMQPASGPANPTGTAPGYVSPADQLRQQGMNQPPNPNAGYNQQMYNQFTGNLAGAGPFGIGTSPQAMQWGQQQGMMGNRPRDLSMILGNTAGGTGFRG